MLALLGLGTTLGTPGFAQSHLILPQTPDEVRALTQSAEARFASLDLDAQDVARQLFLRLITPGEGSEDTRRRARRAIRGCMCI